MDVYELGTLDANFLRYGLHNALQKCPLVANREQWNVARINEKLSAPATRLQGLAVLEAYLPQCSDELFGEHAVSWMQQCLHALEAQARSGSAPLAFHVLKTLVQMSSHFSELTKLISSSIVSKALEKIVATMDEDPAPALQCLHALMTHYGGACGASKGVLEQSLLRSVRSPERAAQAARCWAVLVAVGGGGGQRTNHKQQWAAMQLRLCNTLHHLLGRLLHQYRILHVWTEDDDILPLPRVDDENPVASVQKLTKQLCSVSKFLQAMLRGVFPVAKSVSVGEIMELVCRGLAVNCFSAPQKDAGRQVVVVTCIPDIHIAMLGVLEALVACCGRNLIPFGGIVCDLVLQELRWTAVGSPQYASERPFGPVRLAACRVLSAWLDVSKASSLVEKHAEGLVAALLQDVQSSKPTITLSAPTGKTKGSLKDAHKTEASSEALPKRQKLRDGRANSEVCAAALEALRCVVRSAATFMPAKLHKVLQEMVVALVLDVQRGSGTEELPVPYGVPGCRLGLYRLLEALAAWPHGERAPPTHFALAAFSRGQVDLDRQVSAFCTTALGHLEKVAHPACPSLHFPMAAHSAGTDIAPRAEMPTSQMEVETSRNLGLDSFAGGASDKVELGGAEVSDTEEVVVVEAVSGESDSDFDGGGPRVTSDMSQVIGQSDQNSGSPSSAVPEPMGLVDSGTSRDQYDDVSGGNASVVEKPSESSEEEILERMPKKTNRKVNAAKRNALRKETSCAPADVSLIEVTSDESITLVSPGQLKEHERDSDRDSDHCWTTEEAALVRNLVRDFESGDGASVDVQDGSEDDEGIREVAAGCDVSETKKIDSGAALSPKGSKVASKQAASSKKIRKREASPSPVSAGPQDKRQKTDDTLQAREDENVQDDVVLGTASEGDIEDMGRVASNDGIEERVVHELNVSEEHYKTNVEQPENLTSASEQTEKECLVQGKEQEICSSAIRLTSGHSECIETRESKEANGESDDTIEECSTQFDTSKENSDQAEGHNNNGKESGSVHDSPAQLEICDENSKQIEGHDDSQKESGSVQDCPVGIESYDENSEQFEGQNDNQEENDSVHDCPTQMENCDEISKQMEGQDDNQEENDSVHDCPTQMENCDEISKQMEGQDDNQEENDSVHDCPTQMESCDEISKQMEGQDDGQKEDVSVHDCPTQMENCDEISKQMEGQDNGQKEDVSVQDSPTQMETSENCEQVEGQDDSQKESDTASDCPMDVDICDVNVEQVNGQESEQSDKERDLVQRSPVHIETGSADSERVQAQEYGQTEVESDGVKTCPAQEEARGENQEHIAAQESELLEKDDGVAEVSPSQVGTREGGDCQVSGESNVQSEHKARGPHTEGEEASLQEKNGVGTLPEGQGSN